MSLLPCFLASYGADRPFLSGSVISQDLPNGSKVRGCLSCRKTRTVNTKRTFWRPEWLRTRDHNHEAAKRRRPYPTDRDALRPLTGQASLGVRCPSDSFRQHRGSTALCYPWFVKA